MRQVLIYQVEDGGWVCEVPSLPGCVSSGPTKPQARSAIEGAIDVWIAAARHLRQPVPDDLPDFEVLLVEESVSDERRT